MAWGYEACFIIEHDETTEGSFLWYQVFGIAECV